MKTLFLTNEYPPAIYGGAGVHVDYLSRELAKLMEVDVRAFGNQVMDATNLKVRGFPVDTSKFGCPLTHNLVANILRALGAKTEPIEVVSGSRRQSMATSKRRRISLSDIIISDSYLLRPSIIPQIFSPENGFLSAPPASF